MVDHIVVVNMKKASDDFPELGTPFQDALSESERRLSHAGYLAITEAATVLQQQVADLLLQHALSLTQYSALRAIRRNEGIRLLDLSAAMVHRAPDASRLVERLVKLGSVERTPDAQDRRAVRLRLTRAGRDRLTGIDRLLMELHDRQFAACGSQELKWLIKELASLTG